MPNTREKLIELLASVQHYGIKMQYSQMDERSDKRNVILNAEVANHLIASRDI